MWFEIRQIHSLAQWIVYMFECQIKKAYFQQKKTSSKSCKQHQVPSIYKYLKQNYKSNQNIRSVIQKVIIKQFLKDQVVKSQNYMNKKNFLLTKCMDRLENQYDKYQYLIEYSWYNQHTTNQTYRIFNKVAEQLSIEYEKWGQEWELKKIQEVQKERQQKQKLKRIVKRKKRKEKKQLQKMQGQLKDQKKQQQQQNQIEQQQSKNLLDKKQSKVPLKNQQIFLNKNKKQKQKQIQEKEDIQSISIMKKQLKLQQQNNRQNLFVKNGKQKQKQEVKCKNQKKDKNSQKKQALSSKLKLNENKKVINQRINQYLQHITNQLNQTAAVFDKYRKVVYNLVQHFFAASIFPELQEKIQQGEQIAWKLQLYGSSSAGFSIRNSDIDLVLLTNSKKLTLTDINSQLKFQKWVVQKKVINQAQVPIIKFIVSLKQAPVQVTHLSSKQIKKLQNQYFSVDLTLASIAGPHSGIQNSRHLRQIYQCFPQIRNICILYKQFFRIRGLNKPYTGGIGSYVLIILIFSILSRKKQFNQKNGNIELGMSHMIKQIGHYMQRQFKPFQTLINGRKDSNMIADKNIHLNILNPKTGQPIKTSAFLIDKIVEQFKNFRVFQQQIEKQLLQMDVNQKKKMKSFFLKQFSQFVYGYEQ